MLTEVNLPMAPDDSAEDFAFADEFDFGLELILDGLSQHLDHVR